MFTFSPAGRCVIGREHGGSSMKLKGNAIKVIAERLSIVELQ